VPAAKATVTVVDIRFVLINWGAAMCHVIIYCVLQIKCQNAVEYLIQVCLKFAASTREIGVEVAEFCYISYIVLVLGAITHRPPPIRRPGHDSTLVYRKNKDPAGAREIASVCMSASNKHKGHNSFASYFTFLSPQKHLRPKFRHDYAALTWKPPRTNSYYREHKSKEVSF